MSEAKYLYNHTFNITLLCQTLAHWSQKKSISFMTEQQITKINIKLEFCCQQNYCENLKTMNTRNIYGTLLCSKPITHMNHAHENWTVNGNGNYVVVSCCRWLVAAQWEMLKSNQGVHGFWICTVIHFVNKHFLNFSYRCLY